jgi:hypothetical protein
VAGVILPGDCGYSRTGNPSPSRSWSERAQRNGSAAISRTCQRRHACLMACSDVDYGDLAAVRLPQLDQVDVGPLVDGRDHEHGRIAVE